MYLNYREIPDARLMQTARRRLSSVDAAKPQGTFWDISIAPCVAASHKTLYHDASRIEQVRYSGPKTCPLGQSYSEAGVL